MNNTQHMSSSYIIPTQLPTPRQQHTFHELVIEDMELFLFTTPCCKKTIMITQVPTKVTRKDIHRAFSRFGLIYTVQSVSTGNNNLTVLVKFYTEKSARTALNHHYLVENISIEYKVKSDNFDENGNFISKSETEYQFQCHTMVLSNFKNDKYINDLTLDKSIVAINGLLGFNQWSVEIPILEHGDTLLINIETDDEGNPLPRPVEKYESTYHAQIYCTFKQIDVKVAAIGTGVYIDSCKYEATKQAKKYAISNARRELFKKIGILILKDQRPIPYILDQNSIVLPPNPENDYDYMFDDNQILRDIEAAEQQQQVDEYEQQYGSDLNIDLEGEDFSVDVESNDQEFDLNVKIDFDTGGTNDDEFDLDVDASIGNN